MGDSSVVSKTTPRKAVVFKDSESSINVVPGNQGVKGIKIIANDRKIEIERSSRPTIDGWDLSPQEAQRSAISKFEVENSLMNGLKVDDLEALRDKLKQTIEYLRNDFNLTYDTKMQHDQKPSKKKQSP